MKREKEREKKKERREKEENRVIVANVAPYLRFSIVDTKERAVYCVLDAAR